MSESRALCATCPSKGDQSVDYEVMGSCPTFTVDSFMQTRRYRLEHASDYANNDEMAALSSKSLRYYDAESDSYYEREGDIRAAHLGIACAEQFIAGECEKTENQIIVQSDID